MPASRDSLYRLRVWQQRSNRGLGWRFRSPGSECRHKNLPRYARSLGPRCQAPRDPGAAKGPAKKASR
jgi:hypothetical protein